MLFRISWLCPYVVCADLAVNAKQASENNWPRVFGCRPFCRGPSERPEISSAEMLDRVSQDVRIVPLRPAFLVVQDDPVEPRATNAEDWRPARLALERD